MQMRRKFSRVSINFNWGMHAPLAKADNMSGGNNVLSGLVCYFCFKSTVLLGPKLGCVSAHTSQKGECEYHAVVGTRPVLARSTTLESQG